jgi:AraC family transcriptional regulator
MTLDPGQDRPSKHRADFLTEPGGTLMEHNLLPQRNAWADAMRPPQAAMAAVNAKMLGHLTSNSPFRPDAREVAATKPAPEAFSRDFTEMVVSLLRDATAALGSDREAAKASIARASALLRDEADRSATDATDAPPMAARRGGLAQWQLRRAVAHVDANLTSTIRVSDLAEITRLSKSHFSRAFKVSVGESVHAYIIRRRIERSQELMLTTAEPLCQIGVACGLYDQGHFSRLFRRVVGASPSAWRRQWCDEDCDGAHSSDRSLATIDRGICRTANYRVGAPT